MEQSNQEITQKPVLPIKTKIAAWLVIVLGILLIVLNLLLTMTFFYFLSSYAPREVAWLGFLFFLSFIVPALPFLWIMALGICFLGFFVLKGKKKAWWIVIVLLLIGIIPIGSLWVQSLLDEVYEASLFIGSILILFSLPLALLLLDRKNFFKVAS